MRNLERKFMGNELNSICKVMIFQNFLRFFENRNKIYGIYRQ